MMIKVRWEKLGGHYHCAVFTGKGMNMTFAKCGDLVFDEQEWPEIRDTLFGNAVMEER